MSTPAAYVPMCHHSDAQHFFADVFCIEQSNVKKIAIIAFHILTLGIPLAVYRIYHCCFPKKAQATNPIAGLQPSVAVQSVQQSAAKPYSAIGKEAIEFARKKLKENPSLVPWQVHRGGGHQPVNPEIPLLAELYCNVDEALENMLKKHKINPWSQKEVIDAADTCLKVAYAVSALTLDDLPEFTKKLAQEENIHRNYVLALTEQDSYQYRTFFFCSQTYHLLRGGIAWRENPYIYAEANEKEGLFYPKDEIAAKFSKPFYKKGTLQNTWNTLYNDYCDRVRLYVNEKNLAAKDTRHVNWTQKDQKSILGKMSFRSIPDTLPT